ncbi:MAG: comEA protein, partial [Phycisphaerales bacterium]|nr:comEA protein [Phycisphaerales bacterium]
NGGGRGGGGGNGGGGGRGNGGGNGGGGQGGGGGFGGGNGGGGGGGGAGTVSADFFAFADLVRLQTDDLAKIEPFITGSSTTTSLPGLININTAPRDVLLTLGSIGLSSTNVDAMLAARTDAVAANPGTIGWVRDAVPDIANIPDFASHVTGQGRQYSADIVAASGNGRGFRHVRIVVDTTSSPARIVYRRDLTDRGWPMDKSILDDLRAGLGVNGQVAGSQTTTGTAQPAATGAR